MASPHKANVPAVHHQTRCGAFEDFQVCSRTLHAGQRCDRVRVMPGSILSRSCWSPVGWDQRACERWPTGIGDSQNGGPSAAAQPCPTLHIYGPRSMVALLFRTLAALVWHVQPDRRVPSWAAGDGGDCRRSYLPKNEARAPRRCSAGSVSRRRGCGPASLVKSLSSVSVVSVTCFVAQLSCGRALRSGRRPDPAQYDTPGDERLRIGQPGE